MKNFSYIILSLVGFSSISVYAQDVIIHQDAANIVSKRKETEAATGSMYINDKYIPAKVSGSNQTVLLRYNAYSDFFEISNPQSDEIRQLPQTPGVTITFLNSKDTYTLVDFINKKEEAHSGYLNMLSDNAKVKIYKRESIFLQPEVIPTSSYASYKAPNYKKANEEFYIKIGEQEAKYYSGKKDLAKLVPGKNKEVLAYIKENKIDVEKKEDLIKLGMYINSIL